MRPALAAALVAGLLLGGRAEAATITVSLTTDTVDGVAPWSLREAMGLVGAGDSIAFSTVVFPSGSVTSISVSGSALPALNDNNVTVDGGGRVRIAGTSGLPAGTVGLHIVANGVTVKGMDVQGFKGAGIEVVGGASDLIGTTTSPNVVHGNAGPGVLVTAGAVVASGVSITGNRIGTDLAGTTADGNCTAVASQCAGVVVDTGTTNTTVTGNTISGTVHGSGLVVMEDPTTVTGNFVGTNGSGTSALANHGAGIVVVGSAGGPLTSVTLSANVVSGNDDQGILLGSHTSGVIVQSSFVGTNASGTAAIGNGLDGIKISGSDDHQIGSATVTLANVISGNGGSGIAIGGATGANWASGAVIRHNFIGTDASGTSAIANKRYGIVTGGKGGGHLIGAATWALGGNLISGNDLGGVWIGDPDDSVMSNRIGTNAAGSAAIGNGANPLSSGLQVFGGVLVTGRQEQIGDTGAGNLVSGNTGDGILLLDPGPGFRIPHYLYANLIGTDLAGTADLGNSGDGVHVETGLVRVGDVGYGNVISANDGAGVRVEGTDEASVFAVWVIGNAIGADAAGLAPPGNGDGGVVVAQSATALPVVSNRIESNDLYGNQQYGIYLTGPTTDNRLSQNLLDGTELCAIHFDEDANGAIDPPIVTSATSTLISGTVPTTVVNPSTVEVYSDADYEASTYLGQATVAADGTWSLAGTGFPALTEIRALVHASLATSSFNDLCGDGCEDVQPACGSVDLTGCTYSYCDEENASCTAGNRPEGWRCVDFDGCTGIVNATRFEPDECDGLGTCVGGTPMPGPAPISMLDLPKYACPWATDCLTATCGGSNEIGCTYEPICEDAFPGSFNPPGDACGPLDFDQTHLSAVDAVTGDTIYEDGCDYCGECDHGSLPDDDEDSIPNAWEGHLSNGDGVDTDCDGTADYEIPGADPGVMQIFLEIDYMALDCADPTELHNHRPSQADLDDLVDIFAAHDVDGHTLHLVYEIDECLPESALVSFNSAQTGDPDCGAEDFQFFSDIKAQHFDKRRRGIYHYVLIAHGGVGDDFTTVPVPQDSDGVCTGDARSRSEAHGMDVLITKSTEPVLSDDVASLHLEKQTTSLMHELGHNLGLHHAGPAGLDNIAADPSSGVVGDLDNVKDEENFKPNYQSVMNYRYEWNLVPVVCASPPCAATLNYSEEAMPSLTETGLNEDAGIVSARTDTGQYEVTWDCPPGVGRGFDASAVPDGSDIDWDCDGDPAEHGASADVNGSLDATQTLVGYEDWSTLMLNFQCGHKAWGVMDGDDVGENDCDLSEEEARDRGVLLPRRQIRVDVVPSCGANPILVGPGAFVEVVAFGESGWALGDIASRTIMFQGARPRWRAVADVDSDGHPDARLWFDSADLALSATASHATLSLQLASSQVMTGRDDVSMVTSIADADGDGVWDPCDACASTPTGTPVDATGCP